jgi:uncharacterized repeat protein (TIGR03803 family)
MNTKLSASKIGLLIVLAMATASASLAAQDKPAFWHIKTLYTFTGNADGAVPYGGVVLDPAGNVYGTTTAGGNGGANCGNPPNCGVVFKIGPTGHESLLHTFTGPSADGASPTEGVTRDSAGRLYGLSGAFLTVYELQPSATFCAAVLCPWNESLLYNSEIGQLGGIPTGIPIFDAQGNIYAASNAGGSGTNCAGGCGFIFKVDPQGQETVIYNFQGGSADGGWPTGPLLLAADGSLYGTTDIGGPSGYGTVYEIDADGNESVLYSFTGGNDGGAPQTGVIADGEGNLYGTTLIGGQSGPGCVHGGTCGVVFELIPNQDGSWTESVLYRFQGGADGANPFGLLRDSQGNFYGTTQSGGACLYGPYCGTVYKLDSAANRTTLWNFTAGTDGLEPGYGSLVMDQQGSLYGTTFYGGDDGATNPACTGFYGPGCGVVFKLTP